MGKIEILAPAGSPEGVTAVVQNGADAVYMGLSAFNARRGAKNFTPDEFARACEYCRVRGVKAYLALNTLVSDRELPEAVAAASDAARAGADAVIVADLGLLRALRRALPGMPLHCSTQMGLHSSEGVRLAYAMGARRAVLARELARGDIAGIASGAPLELEVFVHGAHCVSHSGQCYFSAVIGGRSGNRGLCAQPCRLPYGSGGRKTEYPLSLKDNCLAAYVGELERMGIKSLKIEGRMKRPEYAAVVTGIYARAAREGKPPSEDDMAALRAAFSRQGFTDGYYTGARGADMLGVREYDAAAEKRIFAAARRNYTHGELQRVPVRFAAVVRAGKPARLVAVDDRRNAVAAEGDVPEPAFHRQTDAAAFSTQLHKTGGTPFYCAEVKLRVEPGLALSAASINALRREALEKLLEKRRPAPAVPVREYDAAAALAITPPEARPAPAAPVFTVSVTKAEQLSKELLELRPRVLYVPLPELRHLPKLKPFLDDPDITVAAALPRVMFDSERDRAERILAAARNAGIADALCGNLGQILPMREAGFNIRGDFGLNLFSSYSLAAARELGFASAAASFEMNLAQLRDAVLPLDTEAIVYGRLPLMLTENCVIRASLGVCSCAAPLQLSDRTGASFPVIRENAGSCRNVVLNSRKLFLADRLSDFSGIGLWGLRLAFTTENAVECAQVARRYMGLGEYAPGAFTRGLYYSRVT
ncbi:MAG: U32 family peptidase [Oscillospiraceae bacterium]|jgi:putative protease|nr:U32 family peptidase [Oscillospiraceae bacterium]